MKKKDGSTEDLDRYFMRKFKELGLDVDAPRKRTRAERTART